MTVRTLVLLRHAHAPWPAGVSDEERTLSARGRRDARAAGVWLAGRARPDVVLCSPARRTRETWQQVAEGLAAAGNPDGTPEPAVRFEPALFRGGAAALLAAIRGVDDAATTVLLIGHNPDVSRLAAELDPAADLRGTLPTATLVVHQTESPWRELALGRTRLIAVHTARA